VFPWPFLKEKKDENGNENISGLQNMFKEEEVVASRDRERNEEVV